MSFNDTFRLSSHAVITNSDDQVLLLHATYGKRSWGLPGGCLECGETVHEALIRECQEELGCLVEIKYLSGIYYHSEFNSQAFIFRCELKDDAIIQLSDEHSSYKYENISDLSPAQKQRVTECLEFSGTVCSAKF